jgi:hypothetical protein
MDLRLFMRVLWRSRFLVAFGLAAALALALLAFVRVSFDGTTPRFSYRTQETWESQALLLLTQSGFPWGRSVIPTPELSPTPTTETTTAGGTVQQDQRPRQQQQQQFGETERFSGLAALYSTLATSDAVRQAMLRDGPINGIVSASPVMAFETLPPESRPDFRTEDPLPLLRIAARSNDPATALALSERAVQAFLEYLREQQRLNHIPVRQRVVVSVLAEPQAANMVVGRSKLYPALVFVGLAVLTLLAAFAVENLRPRARPPVGGNGAVHDGWDRWHDPRAERQVLERTRGGPGP